MQLSLPSDCDGVKGWYMTKRVLCFKTEYFKHRESKLILLSFDHTWAVFQSLTVALEEQIIWDRVNCLTDSAADQPCALEIRYHQKCWFKYVCAEIPENEWRWLTPTHAQCQSTWGSDYVLWPRQKSYFRGTWTKVTAEPPTRLQLYHSSVRFHNIWGQPILHEKHPDMGIWR